MSELIDQIAAEHWFTMNNGWHCVGCGYNDFTAARDSYALAERGHLVDVTERAVREDVAKEILDQETWLRGCVDFTANERQVGMINGYRLAARIAKGD